VSFAKSLCPILERDFFLLGASSSVWDCRRFVDRRKMLAGNVNCARPGYKERRLAIRKWLLSLRCDCITMVQPAESRQGLNMAFTRRADFCRPTCWRVLRESKMSPILVIVE